MSEGVQLNSSRRQSSMSPVGMVRSLVAHRGLIRSLIVREIVGRYRGSAMGLLWSFFNPILMLAVYTFVFSYVFNARWGGAAGTKTEFAMVLFSGLMIFNFFAECCNRAPILVMGNVGFVKKVVFPLEILPVVSMGSALFHLLVSFLVWLAFHMVFLGMPHLTLLLVPVVLLPLVLATLGITWILASLGVYLRDVAQVVGVLMLVLMYMSPIFYPISIMPPAYRTFMSLSPITYTVEQMRGVMMWGHGVDWQAWGIALGVSLVVAMLGYAWFQKTRMGFADVL